MDKNLGKRRKKLLIICALIGASQQIHLLQSKPSDNDLINSDAIADQDTLDAMAYSENALSSNEQQIKTKAYIEPPKVEQPKILTKAELKASQLNEDQAFAAYAQEKMVDAAQDVAQPEEVKVITQSSSPKGGFPTDDAVAVTQKPPEIQQIIDMKEESVQGTGFDDDKSDVDVSSIMADHKDTKAVSIKAQDSQVNSMKPKQPRKESYELPEADVDISAIDGSEDKSKKMDPDDIAFDEQLPTQEKKTQAVAQKPKKKTKSIKIKVKDHSQEMQPEKPAEKPAQSQKKGWADEEDEMSDLSGGTSIHNLVEEGQAAVDAQKKTQVNQENIENDLSLVEQAQRIEKLQKEKEDSEQKAKEEEKKQIEKEAQDKVHDSLWGQMDEMTAYSKVMVTNAQGFEDPEPVEPVPPPPPKPVLSQAEQEKENQEKMKLFSEYVAADAESSEPVIKKEVPKEQPLHFKYYQNEGQSETDILTDSILGAESHKANEKRQALPYDHSDSGWNVTPMAPVDYNKAQIDVKGFMEPIKTVDISDIQVEQQKPAPVQDSDGEQKEQETIELTTS